MQSKPDLLSSVNQNFIGNEENTMDLALCANVGLILFKLEKHCLKNPLDNSVTGRKSTISAEQVDAYIDALSQHIVEQGKAEQSGWQYIQQKLDENVNELDSVTIWENGKDVPYRFELKTTLALVYAALTDKEVFWEKALANRGLASPEEIVTFRKEFDETYPQDQANRLLTLLNCFSDLEFKRVCHTGIRNDIVMTLNGVYPDVRIIENVDAFLLDAITTHLHQQIDNFKSQPELYRNIILAKMDSELLDPLKKALEKSQLKFEDSIKITCAEHGINPQHLNLHPKIDEWLGNIKDLPLTWEDNVVLSSLSAILALIPKEKDDPLDVVQVWIKSHFELGNEQHEKQVVSFVQVQKTISLFKKYAGLLEDWNPKIVTKEHLEYLGSQLKNYEEFCLQNSSPQQASEDLVRLMQLFEKNCTAFAKDERSEWVESFFTQWSVAKRHNNDATLIQLYSNLHEPVMQTKYEVNSAFLEKYFPIDTKLEVTPYLVNRLFLHAITVHPKNWSQSFFERFSKVYTVVSEELAKEELGHETQSLKKDSYPNALMKQLKYLQGYYQFLQEDQLKEPDSQDFYVPMKQFILTVKQLRAVIKSLSETQKIAFIESWDHKFLKSILNSSHDLSLLTRDLPLSQISTVINSLGNDGLKALIKDVNDLNLIDKSIPEPRKKAFIEALNNDFLKSIITNGHELKGVMDRLSVTQKTAFMEALDNNFLKSIIKNSYELRDVISCLSENQQTVFTDALNKDFLKSIIPNSDQLHVVASCLLGAQEKDIMGVLDNESLQLIIQNRNGLKRAITTLPIAQITTLMKTLDNDFLISHIKNGEGLDRLFNNLPELQKKAVIEALDDDFLKAILKTSTDFSWVIACIPEEQKAVFKKTWDIVTPEGLDIILNDYLINRSKKGEVDGKATEYLHYSFFSPFQASFTQKQEAVEALRSVLKGDKIEDLNQHLPTLRNGELGQILRQLIKESNVTVLVGKEVNTVSDFIQALQENMSNQDQTKAVL